MSYRVFVNQIYVETTGDLFVLNGETIVQVSPSIRRDLKRSLPP